MNDPDKTFWRAGNLLFGLILEATCGCGQQAREKAAGEDLTLAGGMSLDLLFLLFCDCLFHDCSLSAEFFVLEEALLHSHT